MLMIVMVIDDQDYCEEDDDQNTDHNGDEQWPHALAGE